MAKKADFSNVNIAPEIKPEENSIEAPAAVKKATSRRGQKYEATPEERDQRQATMKTQGKKGAGLKRFNMAFTNDNYDYIKTSSIAAGCTHTQFVNAVIAAHMAEHREQYEAAKKISREFGISDFIERIEP